MTFIKCILPLKLSWEPYYRTDSEVYVGERVRVSFARKEYVAVVSELVDSPDVPLDKILSVTSIEHDLEIITEEEIKFWKFIAKYYLCTVGEVYKAAYPGGRTKSEKTAAGVRERMRASKERKVASIAERIERLRQRLAKKEEMLAKKHSESVTERLESERDSILEQILKSEEAMKRVASRTKEETALDSVQTESLPEPLHKALEGGVTLIQGTDRLDTYIRLAASTLADGKDVLFMVPEIVFTEQLTDTLEDVFPGRLLTFHSHESVVSRREVAAKLREKGAGRLILGTRSALFLPFAQLGLIIVDEEHDTSYKQDSPAPRYHGRDAAVMLSRIHACSVVLGSATPSLESIHNVICGRYASITLEESAYTTDIEVIDTFAEKRKNGMLGEVSRKLLEAVNETGGKVLTLLPWNPNDELVAAVHEHLDCEIKTTYASKNMRLEGYSLIAVLHAEFLLKREDFRADERALQLLSQLRSRSDGARIVIQTSQAEHPVFQQMLDKYDGSTLLEERKDFDFPPYSRMIEITVRDANEARLKKLSHELVKALPVNAIGPLPKEPHRGEETPSMSIRALLPRTKELVAQKESIYATITDFEKSFKYPGHITIDVDPV